MLTHFQDLPHMAQMNIEMDTAAKAKVVELEESQQNLADNQCIAGKGWTVWVDGVKQTLDPGPTIAGVSSGKR